MPEDDGEITAYLARNPRKLGLLFLVLLTLGTVGTAAAAIGGTTPGP